MGIVMDEIIISGNSCDIMEVYGQAHDQHEKMKAEREQKGQYGKEGVHPKLPCHRQGEYL